MPDHSKAVDLAYRVVKSPGHYPGTVTTDLADAVIDMAVKLGGQRNKLRWIRQEAEACDAASLRRIIKSVDDELKDGDILTPPKEPP